MGRSSRSRIPATARLLAALALAFACCAERRELTLSPRPQGVTYEGTIRPIFEQHCVSCHGTTSPAGNYSMTTYDGVLGNGSDAVPNAIPGDPQSLLLIKSLPGGSMNAFYSGAEEVALVERWVVEDSLAIQ